MSATKYIPQSAQFSDAAEHRNFIFQDSFQRLQHFAFRASNVFGRKNDEVVIVCIEVDTDWRWLVDMLMPEHDWNKIRDSGLGPIARGSAGWGVCDIVADAFPSMKEVALSKPDTGVFKAIVLNYGGCTIYDIAPKEMSQ